MTRHEVLMDTEIAAAFEAMAKARSHYHSLKKSVEWATKNGRQHDIDSLKPRIEAAHKAFAEANGELSVAELSYDGWSRFFLVQASNGHIHRDMACSTCFPTTQYAWLPELSGLGEAAAVEEYGAILCSICYPSAPVEWTNGTNKKEQADKYLRIALQLIERSKEGKAVKLQQSNLSSKVYNLETAKRDLARYEEELAAGREMPEWMLQRGMESVAKITKFEGQITKIKAKLAAAETALEDALRA